MTGDCRTAEVGLRNTSYLLEPFPRKSIQHFFYFVFRVRVRKVEPETWASAARYFMFWPQWNNMGHKSEIDLAVDTAASLSISPDVKDG